MTLILALAATGFGLLILWGQSRRITSQQKHPPETALRELFASSPSALEEQDIARLNLLGADGLPQTERINVQQCLQTLEEWSRRIKSETDRHSYRFRKKPQEFENSEGFFHLLMMAVVLAEDFQVRYNPARASSVSETSGQDHFFADPQDVFLHGLLGPRRMGTCSSMPVLYVALGRRLGYPVSLVTTKGHLFVRWEDAKERFNVETTGRGLERYDDDYFKKWPFPVTDEEIQAEGYLKSLTPAEELAVFLSIRGLCLKEAGRNADAAEAFTAAVRFAPNCRGYRVMLASLQRNLSPGALAKQTTFELTKPTK